MNKRISFCFLMALVALCVFAYAKNRILPGLSGPVTFDGHYYQSIGLRGYQFNGDIEQKQNVSYLPLMGMIIGAIEAISSGNHHFIDVAIIGFLILFATLVGIYRFVLSEADDASARLSVILWALSPLAFYNFTGYADPLFAMLSVWVLVFIVEERIWLAAVFAGIAMLARPQAVILVVFVLAAAVWLKRLSWRSLMSTEIPLQAAVMAFPILCFASYCAVHFSDSALYVNSLEAFRRGSFTDGDASFVRGVMYFVSAASKGSPNLTTWTAMIAMFSVTVMLGLLMFAIRSSTLAAMLYVAMLLFVFAAESFCVPNIARHLFYLVPWVILAGIAAVRDISNRWVRTLAISPWLLFSVLINIVAVGRFYRGMWVS